MHQESISTPAIQIGPGRSLLTATRMHVTASFFRTVVWTMTGDGKDFDDIVYVPTPGLGTGKARCAICRPQRGRTPDATKGRPLVMVFEGGGFILGQPEDGQAFCRRIADEVFIDLGSVPNVSSFGSGHYCDYI
jgi:acetyl esterase/lipase